MALGALHNSSEAVEFAHRWISAWNRHDVETVLADYADEVVFSSPTAQRVVPESGGVVHGKDALRSYWTRALEQNGDLHFTLLGVYSGIDTVAWQYRNEVGRLICEVTTMRDGLVVAGHATHRRPHDGAA